ncbi:hypothetical protein [Spirochaeta cellobiosiphila]|uniref:hypothetical protein n=1 Tax=Spirochaeta cellobiosiphila TaxID=504483 RepID=UPI00048F6797|nr:hypothetical protein [Spirochaeta cellobiosiphila]
MLDFGKSEATSIASCVIPGVGSLGSFGESLGDTIGGKITESLIDGAVNNAVSGIINIVMRTLLLIDNILVLLIIA